MQFQSLEQHMLHTYLDTFPPFVPLRRAQVSEESQRQLHAFFGGMYRSFVAAGLEKLRTLQLRRTLADEGYNSMKKDVEAIEHIERLLEKEDT